MNAVLVLVAMLALIGTMLTVAMLIAWRDFGRPPYALAWAAAFATITLQWIITLGLSWFDMPGRSPASPFQFLQLANSALLAYGFTQRAGRNGRGYWLLGGWLAASLLGTFFIFAMERRDLATLLPKSFSAAALIFAATMVMPRGRPPSPAERGMALMLSAFALCEATLGITGALGGAHPDQRQVDLYRTISSLGSPACFTGVGLFTVFLIAADLSSRMQRLARTDPLTGLLNRRGLDDAIATLSARWARGQRRGCVVLADLDSFKQINDRAGHLLGDRVLRAFAQLGRGSVRRGELIGRIGGEEFAMLLPGCTMDEVAPRIEALRKDVAAITMPGLASGGVTASFGVAEMDPASLALDTGFAEALGRADAALIRAKGAGRNRVLYAEAIGLSRDDRASRP